MVGGRSKYTAVVREGVTEESGGSQGDGKDQGSQAGHEMNIPHLLLVFYQLLILSQCFL